ncbi:MAG: hypothetical protein D3910_00425 [Candidatus Electrothrix sp. ATG2]|nr:hypothetical protein [Candidatus Electrothrix sp. ATG2]
MLLFFNKLESNEHIFCQKSFHDLFVFTVAAVTFVIGIVYSFYLGNSLSWPDERDYISLARSMMENHIYSIDGIHPTARRAPGLPFILYIIFQLGGEILHVRLFQFALYSLSILLIFQLLKSWRLIFAGVLASILIPCYPVLFYLTGTLYPQSLASFLFIIVFVMLFKKNTPVWQTAVAGFFFGYLVLTVPTFLVLAPLFLTSPWLLKYKSPLSSALIFIFFFFSVLAPWVYRNYSVFDKFVFVSANSGLALIQGNSVAAHPEVWWVDISQYQAIAFAECGVPCQGLTAKEAHIRAPEFDASLRVQAIHWIVANKIKAFKLYALKFLHHFDFSNQLYSSTHSALWKDLLILVTYYPLLALSIFRLLAKGRNLGLLEIYISTAYLLFAMGHAIFITRIRLRLPLDWVMICLAAIQIQEFCYRYMGQGDPSGPPDLKKMLETRKGHRAQ